MNHSTKHKTCLDKNWKSYIGELSKYVSFKSISSEPSKQSECIKCADFLCNTLKSLNFNTVERVDTPGLPIIYGHYLADKNRPTLMIYGHYDVQPADPLNEWDSAPFNTRMDDEYIYGRGVSDNKGQFWTYIMALRTIMETEGRLPLNIKLIIEGEEEIGSHHLFEFIDKRSEELKSDIFLISDNPMLSKNQPSICTSLRGIACFELSIQTSQTDLHSGLHGGAVPNALDVLSRFCSEIKDKYGAIRIPDFYENVSIPEHIKPDIKNTLPTDNDYLKNCGSYYLEGEFGYSSIEQRWYRPTLEIHGITGGFTGPGIKTVIPSKASVKISMRLVKNQHPKAIMARVKKYIKSTLPQGVLWSINEHHGALPLAINKDHINIQRLSNSIQAIMGTLPICHGEGGSIPILAHFQNALQIDPILFGLGLPDDNIHAPNERFLLKNAYNGVLVICHLIEQINNGT